MPKLVVESIQSSCFSIGGRPIGIENDAWPACRSCGANMQFLAQLPLSEHDSPAFSSRDQVLLLFQCQASPGLCDEWDPESGGNAAILIRSNENVPAPIPDGEVLLSERSDLRFVVYDDSIEIETLDDGYVRAYNTGDPVVFGKIGGRPLWIQDDETPLCSCHTRMEFWSCLSKTLDKLRYPSKPKVSKPIQPASLHYHRFDYAAISS